MAEEGGINRKALAALIVVFIMILTPLAVLYITSDDGEGEVVFDLFEEGNTGSEMNLTLQDLRSMDSVEGDSSYQNFFTNWGAYGHYKGVKVADLVDLVGEMDEGDNVTVSATDGYNQTYCWRNVLNRWPDPDIQGDMVLAYEFNGTQIPEWEEGPMIVFLPPDGAYSNQDCLETSCEGQGGNVYLSAGARWVRNAETLELKKGETSFTFAVMGDSQGNNLVLEAVIDGINSRGADLVLHLGDTVPRATTALLDTFNNAISSLEAELRVTPGNHDVMVNGTLFYEYFETGDYYFDKGDCRFISIDSSSQDISDSQFAWLRATLEESTNKRVIVFSHVPSYDPRVGDDHHLDDPDDCMELQSIMDEYDVDLVLNGHVHLYHEEVINDAQYIISGGAGGTLYAPPEEGGFHHFVMFNVTADTITWEVIEVEVDDIQAEKLVVIGPEGNITITINELLTMTALEGYGSYENFYGNWGAEGNYTGVLISDLIELVGGMGANDTLRIASVDGYYQDFCYCNVYPNSTWLALQGPFILAYMYEGETPPQWEEGFRTAFLPDDGGYSNQDCLATSCEGQGGNLYLSAGSRWVKYVVSIEVIVNS